MEPNKAKGKARASIPELLGLTCKRVRTEDTVYTVAREEMRSLSLTASFVFFLPAVAVGQNLQSIQIANSLGTLIASEAFCGLEYDQQAIEAYIDENVDAGDMGFASTLEMMIGGASFQMEEKTESARTAHCRAIERTARHHGFIEN